MRAAPHPHRPLTDLEFHALLPYLLPRSPQGRRIADLRTRIDGIFHIACSLSPWRELPPQYGRPDTLSRYFRRLTEKGLWQRLLDALAHTAPNHPLRAIQHFIFRACRRASRQLGLAFNRFVREIGFPQALPGPPHLIANPLLSETCAAARLSPPKSRTATATEAFLAQVGALKTLWSIAAGRARLPRALKLGWL
ncbi:transposase [Acetobacteraceae bacterium H6797]|nr:transposase [Acetobacteraceae bacterium H6797]